MPIPTPAAAGGGRTGGGAPDHRQALVRPVLSPRLQRGAEDPRPQRAADPGGATRRSPRSPSGPIRTLLRAPSTSIPTASRRPKRTRARSSSAAPWRAGPSTLVLRRDGRRQPAGLRSRAGGVLHDELPRRAHGHPRLDVDAPRRRRSQRSLRNRRARRVGALAERCAHPIGGRGGAAEHRQRVQDPGVHAASRRAQARRRAPRGGLRSRGRVRAVDAPRGGPSGARALLEQRRDLPLRHQPVELLRPPFTSRSVDSPRAPRRSRRRRGPGLLDGLGPSVPRRPLASASACAEHAAVGRRLLDGDRAPRAGPVHDRHHAAHAAGTGRHGRPTSTFASDVSDLVITGRASEPISFAFVDAAAGDNGGSVLDPPRTRSRAGPRDGRVDLRGGGRAGRAPDPNGAPATYDMTIYDEALNASPIGAMGTFSQVGVVGPGNSPTGGTVRVRVLDATTLQPLRGVTVYSHQELGGAVDFVASGTTGIDGRVSVRERLRAPPWSPPQRRPTTSRRSTACPVTRSTSSSAGPRSPAPTCRDGWRACSPRQLPDVDERDRGLARAPARAIRWPPERDRHRGPLQVRVRPCTDPPGGRRSAVVPRDGGGHPAAQLERRALPAGVRADRAAGTPGTGRLGAGRHPGRRNAAPPVADRAAGADDSAAHPVHRGPSGSWRPRRRPEGHGRGRGHGLDAPIIVGRGIPCTGRRDLRRARGQRGARGPGRRTGRPRAIEADLFLRAAVRDAAGNEVAARPRLSGSGSLLSPIGVPQLLSPAPGGSTGSPGFNLLVSDTLNDVLGLEGRTRGPHGRLHAAMGDLRAGHPGRRGIHPPVRPGPRRRGGTGLGQGPFGGDDGLRGPFDRAHFLYSDLERFHSVSGYAAPVTILAP